MTEFSFQLYCARNFPPMSATLKMLAEVGYKEVEGYSALYAGEPNLAAELKANGLTMPTGHFSLEALKDTSASMRTAEALGVKMLICPAVSEAERSQGEAGWTALGETLAGLAEVYTGAGFSFGWHSHAFEFVPTASGKLPMNIILDTAPALEWELDIGWLIRAKQAPFDWFQQYGPRITAIHVKDIALPGEGLDEDGWADIGYGTLDWQGLFTEIKANTKAKYFVMEHDKPSDPARFARRSLATAKGWK